MKKRVYVIKLIRYIFIILSRIINLIEILINFLLIDSFLYLIFLLYIMMYNKNRTVDLFLFFYSRISDWLEVTQTTDF